MPLHSSAIAKEVEVARWAKFAIVGGCLVVAVLFTKPKPFPPDLGPPPRLPVVTFGSNAKPKPCRATFERVRPGMAFVEVCFLLGSPPDYFCDGHNWLFSWTHTETASWFADDGRMMIQIDELGIVTKVKVSREEATASVY